MNNVHIFADKQSLAADAASRTINLLKEAIEQQGRAVWVLAGGSTPLLAYEIIAGEYHQALDWSKVTIVLGDERMGAPNGPDNNWHAITTIIGHLPTTKLQPNSDGSAEDAAIDYEKQLTTLPCLETGLPQFDVVWLGVGEDGHTLSLFPKHPSLLPTTQLVIPVHDSPKPPADRISLSLRALLGAKSALILASGSDKYTAVHEALAGGHSPIALAASIISTHDGDVSWLIDEDAAATD